MRRELKSRENLVHAANSKNPIMLEGMSARIDWNPQKIVVRFKFTQRNVRSISRLVHGSVLRLSLSVPFSFWTWRLWSLTGNEVQRGTKQKLDLLYGVDFEGSSLLHLAIDSGVLKVTCKNRSSFFHARTSWWSSYNNLCVHPFCFIFFFRPLSCVWTTAAL